MTKTTVHKIPFDEIVVRQNADSVELHMLFRGQCVYSVKHNECIRLNTGDSLAWKHLPGWLGIELEAD